MSSIIAIATVPAYKAAYLETSPKMEQLYQCFESVTFQFPEDLSLTSKSPVEVCISGPVQDDVDSAVARFLHLIEHVKETLLLEDVCTTETGLLFVPVSSPSTTEQTVAVDQKLRLNGNRPSASGAARPPRVVREPTEEELKRLSAAVPTKRDIELPGVKDSSDKEGEARNEDRSSSPSAAPPPPFKMLVPPEMMGYIVGKEHKNMRALVVTGLTRYHVSKPSEVPSCITLYGPTAASIQTAKEAIVKMMRTFRRQSDCFVPESVAAIGPTWKESKIVVPEDGMGRLIGKGGANIAKLQSQGVRVIIPSKEDGTIRLEGGKKIEASYVTLVGQEAAVERVKKHIKTYSMSSIIRVATVPAYKAAYLETSPKMEQLYQCFESVTFQFPEDLSLTSKSQVKVRISGPVEDDVDSALARFLRLIEDVTESSVKVAMHRAKKLW